MKLKKFKKIPRLSREILISEKLDGMNSQVMIFPKYKLLQMAESEIWKADEVNDFIEKYCLYIHPDNPHVEEDDRLYLFAGSRTRFLDTSKNGDTHGFVKWVKSNAIDLISLGEGIHYGEFYGHKINRNYKLDYNRFALFDVGRWNQKFGDDCNGTIRVCDNKGNFVPLCCELVPILYEGIFDTNKINEVLENLKNHGSYAVSGFMNPEGIVIYHKASGALFKKTIKDDVQPKGKK